ncbi:hypothetical protein D6829_01330 [Candidatus Pacearchaeota archaeon]|nr:MAG: hypothetical protein D6829_01330 [Candidatus Pacearchaeota archaeon]
MSLKEIRDAMSGGTVYFGIRQTLKNAKKVKKVFVVKDVREETVRKLKEAGFSVDFLKPKSEVSKELGIGFECEVFSIV